MIDTRKAGNGAGGGWLEPMEPMEPSLFPVWQNAAPFGPSNSGAFGQTSRSFLTWAAAFMPPASNMAPAAFSMLARTGSTSRRA